MTPLGRRGTDPAAPHRERHRTALAWGFADQGFSSATNFGLSLLAGRLLGPAGLGTVFLAFTAYLLIVALQRQLLMEPLVAVTSAGGEDRRGSTASLGLTIAIFGAVVVSLAVATVGFFIPGPIGRGLLLIAPWLAPTMIQDYWRNLLFRDGRAPDAALNDGAWFIAMAIAIPASLLIGTSWAVVGTWGLGALAGAVLGFMQTRVRPASPRVAFRWWYREAWPFGRWNAGAGLVANISTYGTTFVISFVLGASALGGLRAAESVFAPLTMIIPAIALPGLPAVTRAYAAGPDQGRSLAFRLSALALIAATGYILFMLVGGWRFLPLLFGPEFLRYRSLIWPMAAGQLFLAVGIGFQLLIKAQQRGRVLLVNRIVAGILALAMVAVLGQMFGIAGAAWGGAAGSLTSTLVLSYSVLRREPEPTTNTGEGLEPARS